jgi:hypothetical protein
MVIDYKKNIINRMKELQKQSEKDFEAAHIRADDELCNILINFGFGSIIKEYRKIKKHYS